MSFSWLFISEMNRFDKADTYLQIFHFQIALNIGFRDRIMILCYIKLALLPSVAFLLLTESFGTSEPWTCLSHDLWREKNCNEYEHVIITFSGRDTNDIINYIMQMYTPPSATATVARKTLMEEMHE